MSTARAVAHDVLVRVASTDAFADVLLAHRLAAAPLTPADAALATRLVYGTLAWQGWLDHRLAQLVREPLAALDLPVLVALRLGLHQLAQFDRVPAYAAVDGSVRLVAARARGLVNAVLRRADRERDRPVDMPEDPIDRLAVEGSHPRWLVERWVDTFGVDDTRLLLAANNTRTGSVVRAVTSRTTREALAIELAEAGVDADAARYAPHALRVGAGATHVRTLPAYTAGRCVFQGEASQLVTSLLGDVRGARVLDTCAAPGGKTLHLHEHVGERGLVVAVDRSRSSLRRLAEATQRLHANRVHVVNGDARSLPVRGAFDAVLVDAPCTGLGTLSRHPEVRWRRQPGDPARLAALQIDILASAATMVGPGGVLVFAVCTLAEEENADVIARFLATHTDFVVESAAGFVPPAGREDGMVTPEGFLRTLPHRHGMDGFFAARLRRR